jgi:hypothetical protein
MVARLDKIKSVEWVTAERAGQKKKRVTAVQEQALKLGDTRRRWATVAGERD